MQKTIDLTNVYALRSKLEAQLNLMKIDEAAETAQELEVAAQKACYEITGLEHIATPTTWNDFLLVLEKNTDPMFMDVLSKFPPRVGECLIAMAERKSQNAMIGRHTQQPTGRMKGLVQMEIPEGEMPVDIYGKPADIVIDKLAIIPERPSFRINKEEAIALMGSYTQPTKPEGYNVKFDTNQTAVDKLNAQKLRTKTFVNIVPQDQAVRMVNDLQHLANITDDANYYEALMKEIERLKLFANGDVKSITDINFAWTYHE